MNNDRCNGRIQVKVRSDIPYQIIEGLLDMSIYWKEIRNSKSVKRNERVLKLNTLNYKFFKSPILNNFVVKIDPVVSPPWATYQNKRFSLGEYLSLKELTAITAYDMREELQKLSKLRKRDKKIYAITNRPDSYVAYVDENVAITECKESLRNKDSYVALMLNIIFECESSCYNDEISNFLDMVRPYLYEGHPNVVGHIQDESYILNKDICI